MFISNVNVYVSVMGAVDISCLHFVIFYCIFLPALHPGVESQICKLGRDVRGKLRQKRKIKSAFLGPGRLRGRREELAKRSDATVLLLSSLPNSKPLDLQIQM